MISFSRCHLIEIPIYTSEMVQPMIRPTIQSGTLIFITFGFALTFITSALTYWRVVIYVNTMFCVIGMVAQGNFFSGANSLALVKQFQGTTTMKPGSF